MHFLKTVAAEVGKHKAIFKSFATFEFCYNFII